MTLSDVYHELTAVRRIAASPAEMRLLASGAAQSLLTANGTLAGWRWGGPGPRVLLVHGLHSRASHLGSFVAPLCRAGFEVWGFDAPAHGESGDAPFSVVHYGKALLQIEAAFGPFEGVIAHSVGSPASLYAFHHGMRVRSSVHIAGPASLDRVVRRTAAACGLNDADTLRLVAMIEAQVESPVAAMELDVIASGLGHPGLLVHDPADREIPYEESRLLLQAWPQSRLLDAPGTGHRRIIADEQVIAASLAHLAHTIPLPLEKEAQAESAEQ